MEGIVDGEYALLVPSRPQLARRVAVAARAAVRAARATARGAVGGGSGGRRRAQVVVAEEGGDVGWGQAGGAGRVAAAAMCIASMKAANEATS